MDVKSSERLSSHYGESVGTDADLRNSALVALVLPKIAGDTVLDIGCGSGYLLGELIKRDKRVFGVEPNHDLAALLRTRYPAIHVFENTVENLDRVYGKFETISLIDVLEHVEDDKAALMKIAEKLYGDRQVVLVVPAHKWLYGKRDEAMGHYRRYGKKELIAKLHSAGLDVREIRHWNALALLPYWFAEKILGKELNISYRANDKATGIKKYLRILIAAWFHYIERHIDFGFGLSLIAVANKTESQNLK